MTTVAQLQYLEQLRIKARTSRRAAALWRSIDRDHLTASWSAGLAQKILQILTAGQFAAAALAQPYITTAVTDAGFDANPAGAVQATAFAGTASDGRPLLSLLTLPLIETKTRIVAGQSTSLALNGGLRLLIRIVETQVQDAGRAALTVAQTSERLVVGYERHVSTPACGRCLALAGKFYRWSDGFKRHPKCDCTMRPVTRAERRGGWTPVATPQGLYDAMSPQERSRSLSAAAQQAIADGADLAGVVNVRGGMATAGGRRADRIGRPTPELIYRDAHSNRDEALRLLRAHGYIT